MRRPISADSLLLYFLVSFLYSELIFRLAGKKELFTFGTVISFVFLLAAAFLVYLICSFFKGTSRFIVSIFLIGMSAFLYASQFVYYQIFKTYYSIYSASNGKQIFEFWKDITDILGNHSIWLLLFFLPSILLIAAGKKFLSFERIDGSNRLSLASCLILTHVTGIAAVYANGKEQNSAYDLYYHNSYPILSVERLGLITTMRLDVQRLLLGWTPKIDIEAAVSRKSDYPPKKSPADKKNIGSPIEAVTYNAMNIDFNTLAANEKNDAIKEMHRYFSNVQPTPKNNYTGKFKGFNLIFITAEGFSPYAIHKDVTPTLYKMVQEGYQFPNFYNPIWGVSTSDGEYVACTGLIPKSGVWSFQKSGKNLLPFVMGNQLKKQNYKTVAYHNHSYTYYGRNISHPNMGYDFKALGKGLELKNTWPESDLEMMQKTIPQYINGQPFHSYYMTVSGHMQYSFSGNYIAFKNKKHVQHLPYSDQAKAYIATQVELDRALEFLLKELEKAGIADKTLLAISADHYPYGLDLNVINELAGHPVEQNFELFKSTFILYTKGMEPKTIVKPASSLDIIPTLSNLLGLEYDSRLLMGSDMFSDAPPLVIFSNKSFITEKGSFNAVNQKFTANKGVAVKNDYINKTKTIVDGKFYYSAKILETDYYRKLFSN